MTSASSIVRSTYARGVFGFAIAAVLTFLAIGLAARGISLGVRLYFPRAGDSTIDWLWRLAWLAHLISVASLAWRLVPRTPPARLWPFVCLRIALAVLLTTPMLWLGTIADFGDLVYPEERAMGSVLLWLPVASLVIAAAGLAVVLLDARTAKPMLERRAHDLG